MVAHSLEILVNGHDRLEGEVLDAGDRQRLRRVDEERERGNVGSRLDDNLGPML
jgi:hypothetical protein